RTDGARRLQPSERSSERLPLQDDPVLEAMQPAIDRKMPVAFEANEAREILRALKMAKELKLDPIVTGARHAHEVAADLKAQNARVIYSLNYPQRPRALAPDADEPLHVLRTRADAPKVPGELTRAGVSFGFSSAGLADPKDFVKNAAEAVEAGLAGHAAVTGTAKAVPHASGGTGGAASARIPFTTSPRPALNRSTYSDPTCRSASRVTKRDRERSRRCSRNSACATMLAASSPRPLDA